MGIIDSLSKTNAAWATNANVNIKLGNGNSDIDVAAQNAVISLGDGDQSINADVTNYLFVEAGDGKKDINAEAGGNAVLSLGYDDSNIALIAGGNAVIDTKCGDQTIAVEAGGNLVIDTGCCGEDNIVAKAGKNAIINTAESNDNVYLEAKGFAFVSVGTTDPEAEGDDDTVFVKAGSDATMAAEYQQLIKDTFGANINAVNYVSTGDGKDQIAIIADQTVVEKNEGEMLLGALGSGFSISSKADKNTIGAYGDNYQFNLKAEADNDVRTLDFWLRDGEDGKKIMMNDGSSAALKDLVDDVDGKDYTLTQYDKDNNAEALNFFKGVFADAFDNLTASSATTELISTKVETTGMTADQIADKYNLSDAERANLKKVNLTELASDGQPRYALALSPQKSKAAGKDVYVVVEHDYMLSNGAWHGRAVSDKECIAFYIDGGSGCGCNCYCNIDKAEKAEDITGKQITTETYANLENWTTWGVANWSINLNKSDDKSGCGCGCGCGTEESNLGSLMANISARGGYVMIDGQEVNTGDDITNINIIGGHRDSIQHETWEKTIEDWALSVYVQRNSWNSPLILDMDGDGKISSEAGIGVDVDGDGIADGAATGGDKMLAMSDMNGDGTISGEEVFGNNTVSPFTGKKLNAANGFEALKMIAQEAEARGFKCMNGSQVDMAALAKALESVNVKLGFVSGTNNTTLEEFAGVKTINTSYIDTTLENGEQRQHGSFERTNGEVAIIDDVWFQ